MAFNLIGGGIELFAAHVGGRVDDLPLQVGVVHYVEIHDAERAHSGRAQVQRQRRAQSSGANAQHFGVLDLELPFHADLGHDEVARVAQDFFVVQRCRLRRDVDCGGHETSCEIWSLKEYADLLLSDNSPDNNSGPCAEGTSENSSGSKS